MRVSLKKVFSLGSSPYPLANQILKDKGESRFQTEWVKAANNVKLCKTDSDLPLCIFK